jgi:hypothetical protein
VSLLFPTAHVEPCPPLYWGFLITHNYTHGRTTLVEWSARPRDLYPHRTPQYINKRDKQPCPQRDSNLWSQQPSDKLYTCGIRDIPLQLIKSCLIKRTQQVQINQTEDKHQITCHSNCLPGKFEVHQGSVFGLLLSIIRVYDLTKLNCGMAIMHADNTSVLNAWNNLD